MDKNEKIMNTLKEYKKSLEEKGYNVVYIGLYGSQNYNLDDENSDVDARAIVIPKIEEIIRRKSISTEYEFETGKIDVKDILTYYGVIKKGNFSFIEPFQTEWYIGDETIRVLFSTFKVNPHALLGAQYQKFKNLIKRDEWGESIIEYSAKDYHHLCRLSHLLNHIFNTGENISFIKYDGEEAQKMLELKRESINLNSPEGYKMTLQRINEAHAIRDADIKRTYSKVLDIEQPDFEDWINRYILSEVREQLLCIKEEI